MLEGTGPIGPNKLPKIKPIEPKAPEQQAPEQPAQEHPTKSLPSDAWTPSGPGGPIGPVKTIMPAKTVSRMCGFDPFKTDKNCGIVPPEMTAKLCGPVSTVIHPPIGTCFCPNPLPPVPLRTLKGCEISLPKTVICTLPEPIKTLGKICGGEPPIKTASICDITRTCFCPIPQPEKTVGIICSIQGPNKTKGFECIPPELTIGPEKTLGIACGVPIPVKTVGLCTEPAKTMGVSCILDGGLPKTAKGCGAKPDIEDLIHWRKDVNLPE